MVMNVDIEQLTDTSVLVSWDQILADNINYTVYYKPSADMERNEQSMTVPSSESSVVIENLMTNVEYEFQVAATAELEGVPFPGARSSLTVQVLTTTPPPTTPLHTTLLSKATI